ncbi:hypothetical protein F442_12369 [Phytophthora nicotianae P10297]|uniref:Uncharacterized protein n=1 Tax=Phytophthora nicotianae P10297 TaxID=1317064 RepID=W2YYS7_PHYNI|nr:hypothetical protein F442_12369 [Phytophthora nicotianae P10297]
MASYTSPDVVDLTCAPSSGELTTSAVWVTAELDPFSRKQNHVGNRNYEQKSVPANGEKSIHR